MEIFVFKTDINTKLDCRKLAPVFDNLPGLTEWSVDTGDCDKVLRVVGILTPGAIIDLVRQHGFFCEELPV